MRKYVEDPDFTLWPVANDLELIEGVLRGRLGTHEHVLGALESLTRLSERLRHPFNSSYETLVEIVDEMVDRPAVCEGLTRLDDIALALDQADAVMGRQGVEMQDDLRRWSAALVVARGDFDA